MLIASTSALVHHDLQPMARIIGSATSGIEPRVMGFGPVGAIKRVLEKPV